MKKCLLLIVALVTISAYATDCLYINDFNIDAGETKVISVMLDNEITYTAVQCDLVLPEGLSITGMEKTVRCRNHTLTSNVLDNGSTRLWLSSMSSRAISGNSGELIKLTVKAADNFSGQRVLLIQNIVCAHETADNCGERVELPDALCYINRVLLLGDVNLDGVVDIDDLNIIINIILKVDDADNYDGRAYITDDHIVDIDDVNKVINIILKIELFDQIFSVNGVSFTMIPVKGGTFTMGATEEQGSDAAEIEMPAHQVTLSSYYIGETEVTQALWQAVMGSNPSGINDNLQLPVETVSYNDCLEFISQLNELTGKSFRLPTEAEWEYAARGGNKTEHHKWAGDDDVDLVGWYSDNAGNTTHPVAMKKPNELGLYDMSGNVWEWCSDWYGAYSADSQTNPTGPESGRFRVSRGGGWHSSASNCRTSSRTYNSELTATNRIGLRIVL